MDGIKIENHAVDDAQKYVKLTRALILKRILNDSEELTESHRDSMKNKLNHLMEQLEMNEEEFSKALKDLEKENSKETITEEELTEQKETTLYCLSRKCRHQFTVKSKEDASKKCPVCGGPIIFSI